jgi:hypothetical protein
MAHSTTAPLHKVNPEGELKGFFMNYATDGVGKIIVAVNPSEDFCAF